MLVWQSEERNEWAVAVRRALAAPEGDGATGPDPFSLADPPAVRQILGAAGFTAIALADVHEPVFYGGDVAAALDWVLGFSRTGKVLKGLDPVAAGRAVGRLRAMLAPHLGDDGVWFDSRAWLVTARHA